MKIKTKDDRRRRIQVRQRKRIAGSKERPRLSVFRSVTHIYAQVIDDMSGQTLVSASSVDTGLKGAFPKGARGGNIKGAEAIGKAIAERSIEQGIKRVVFDRSGFLYHGRIRAVADAARKAGLEF
jgi:large subunit ribosomal protein L18